VFFCSPKGYDEKPFDSMKFPENVITNKVISLEIFGKILLFTKITRKTGCFFSFFENAFSSENTVYLLFFSANFPAQTTETLNCIGIKFLFLAKIIPDIMYVAKGMSCYEKKETETYWDYSGWKPPLGKRAGHEPARWI
jgi:hypothetical protein